MAKIKNWPFEELACPACGAKTIVDPDAHAQPGLPPTGGDFDYVDCSVNAVCTSCEARFWVSGLLRRCWAPLGRRMRVEYVRFDEREALVLADDLNLIE